MKHKASRMLSTVAAIVGGLAQANLSSATAPVALPRVHLAQPVPLIAVTGSDMAVHVTKTAAGGSLISISCNETPIREAFQKMFQAVGVGYSISSQVSGNVTLQVQSLPINAALSVLLRSSDQPLTYEVVDNVYYIKPQSNSQITPQGTAPSTPTEDAYSETVAPNNTNSQWYKVMLLNAKSQDVVTKLKQDNLNTPGAIPSDMIILPVQVDNTLLVRAPREEFETLRQRLKILDVPAQ